SVGGDPPNLQELASRIAADPGFLSNARALITPGTSLIVTDAPVNAHTRSTPDFDILTASPAPQGDGRRTRRSRPTEAMSGLLDHVETGHEQRARPRDDS